MGFRSHESLDRTEIQKTFSRWFKPLFPSGHERPRVAGAAPSNQRRGASHRRTPGEEKNVALPVPPGHRAISAVEMTRCLTSTLDESQKPLPLAANSTSKSSSTSLDPPTSNRWILAPRLSDQAVLLLHHLPGA
jgi:hypothetical protein